MSQKCFTVLKNFFICHTCQIVKDKRMRRKIGCQTFYDFSNYNNTQHSLKIIQEKYLHHCEKYLLFFNFFHKPIFWLIFQGILVFIDTFGIFPRNKQIVLFETYICTNVIPKPKHVTNYKIVIS